MSVTVIERLAAEAGVDPKAAAAFLAKAVGQRQTAEAMYRALYETQQTGPWRFEASEHAIVGLLDHESEAIEVTLARAANPTDWALAEALLRLQGARDAGGASQKSRGDDVASAARQLRRAAA